MTLFVNRIVLASGLVAGLGLFTAEASASTSREDGLACIEKFYNLDVAGGALEHEGDVLVGVGEGDPQKEVKLIASKLSIFIDYTVLDCDASDNANAIHVTQKDQLPQEYWDRDFIIYNKEWFKSKLQTDRSGLIFVLGHEFGHLVNNHDSFRKNLSRPQKELEADYSGACAVGQLGEDWHPLEALLTDIRSVPSPNYAPLEESLAWARRGYENCHGNDATGAIASGYEGIRVVYFPKEADSGVVETVLKNKSVQYEEGASAFEFASNGMTCTNDIDFTKVRDLAVALTQAGVKLYWINKALNELHVDHRITIEAEDGVQDRWLPLSVEQISCMNSCRWWTSEVDACAN
ncbi:hypothetical protein ACC713_18765 [Rhizobium johnstonii]|uniref:hypothetical protein n=1 Tax=Rhizobium johnstonii TaxID=3019933 RepID=UPI003F98E29C